ncbi:MAG: [FeFe] hydrogenase, group A [Candidatus Sumerlaeota bacterium]
MTETKTIEVNGRTVEFDDERNLLEVIRKAGIDLPTFCYHSDLSVYGACRLCMVNVDGRGVNASCSITPEPGMKIETHTREIRRIRRIAVELLLANCSMQCATCPKSETCKLKDIAHKLGIDTVRFKRRPADKEHDVSSHSVVRDPNKCILCGDCVRACHEIQSVGAIDFAGRGAKTEVLPAFGNPLGDVECVDCGQCAAVCPTGALSVKSELREAWRALEDPEKTVVAQVAPAVRVGLGEYFGMEAGTLTTGEMVAAMRGIGFDQVYDTSFAADLTVVEEAGEFLERKAKGEKLPQFTSCCPAWVRFAELNFPELLDNLSSCRSPQQMFGAVARKMLPEMLGVKPENLVVVSIMPCAAKKTEAKMDKFTRDGRPDVDHVVTTEELGRMVKAGGLDLRRLEPESFDLPLGLKTGAGVIFGASGGVTEAVVRYVARNGESLSKAPEFKLEPLSKGIREATVEVEGAELNVAIVHGLANARKVAEEVRKGESRYDLIEVMACPGGCVNGAGQPQSCDFDVREKRAAGLKREDRLGPLHNSADNHAISTLYEEHLGTPGGHEAHKLLHTDYQNRKRLSEMSMKLVGGTDEDVEAVNVSVCVGTSCFLRGAQKVLNALTEAIEENDVIDRVHLRTSFCFEKCADGPNVVIGDKVLSKCDPEEAVAELLRQVNAPQIAQNTEPVA